MKNQKIAPLIILFWIGCMTCLNAQSSYDIRLKLNHYDTITKLTFYDVQIRSSNNRTWGLAGQNYRLYFDASKADFQYGFSMLSSSYQQLNMIQYIKSVDASKLEGPLGFSETLAFLNFSIDLSDTNNGGMFLSEDGSWLTTAQLVFKPRKAFSAKKLEAVWGRDGSTNIYATSFVEVSEWVASNRTQSTVGANFLDLKPEVPSLYVKLFLQGSYDFSTGIMRDDLRKKGYIPQLEPYSKLGERPTTFAQRSEVEGLERAKEEVFGEKGGASIVDWVFLELRNKDNPEIIESTRAALLQRSGTIVDIDGISPVKFPQMPDKFYLVVRHRNHLGVMSKNLLTPTTIGLDFTDPKTETYGSNARIEENGVMLLWGGNADSNNFLAFTGGGTSLPDSDYIFFDVLTDPKNYNSRINFVSRGYFNGDTNMDGEVRYQGIGTDIDEMIFYNVIRHPENKKYQSIFLIEEQVVPAN